MESGIPIMSSFYANQIPGYPIPSTNVRSNYIEMQPMNVVPNQTMNVPIQQEYSSAPTYSSSSSTSTASLMQYPSLTLNQKLTGKSALSGKVCYDIVDSNGQPIMTCQEESSFSQRFFMGNSRALKIVVTDASGNQLLSFDKPCKFYHQQMIVNDGSGRTIGTVQLTHATRRTEFDILNGSQQPIYTVTGRAYLPPKNLAIVNSQGSEVGSINKEWNGFGKELCQVNRFAVNFPAEADADLRGTLLACAVLTDLVAYEYNGSN